MVGRGRAALLAASVLGAANTANAWRPFDRYTLASVPCFLAGWPTSELPLAALGAQALLDAAVWRPGDGRARSGALSLATSAGLTAASAVGLAALHRVAATAGSVYDRALADGLGDDYADHVVHPELPGDRAASAGAPGVVRTLRVRRRFAHDADVPYGPAGRANRLDVWRRADLPADARAPVLVQVPGGAWVTGDKRRQAYPLLSHLAGLGWVCVAISYRLGPRHRWPAQIVDVKRALAWVRRHIAGYGGDPGFITITGGSAGGHLCALAALTAHDTTWQPGFEDVDTSVAAAVPFYGAYDWTDYEHIGHHDLGPLVELAVTHTRRKRDPELFDAASPMHRIRSGAPPFLVSHGSNDSLIPVEQARLFATRLRSTSAAPVVYAEIPRAQHAFDVLGSVRANLAAAAVARFLGHTYGRHLAGRL